MVADLRLRGMMGRRGLMFVSYYGKSRAFISNYRSWREYDSMGKTAEVASSIISHESIHLALNRFSVNASDKLDNLFGRSNSWEVYPHGLGDLNRIRNGKGSKNRKMRTFLGNLYNRSE
jgi:hypothetical protein